MYRALVTRQRLRGGNSPVSCHNGAVLSALLPSPLYPHVAKYTSATLGVGSSRVEPPRKRSTSCLPLMHAASFPFPPSGYRASSNEPSKHSQSDKARAEAATARPRILSVPDHPQHPPSAATLDQTIHQLLSGTRIPTECAVLSALLQCNRAASLAISPLTAQPRGKSIESDTAASSLLSLDRSVPRLPRPLAAEVPITAGPSDLVDHISQAAFRVVAHPTILITPQVLEAYVVIQARLGKPDTLPHVLGLYRSKPKPREQADSIEYVAQDPDRAATAVASNIVENALDVAIEAKSLDAAVGIIENTYATKAFVRQKLLRKALVPASLAATAPMAVYLAASSLAHYQTSFDHRTATAVAAAGMLAYIGFTGSMGLLAVLTQNDQMSRVTWAPGISLRDRWLREEQRAAFDRVACSFGFSQSHRFGEEEGDEFQMLRRYVLRKGMVLDRVELMEGMA